MSVKIIGCQALYRKLNALGGNADAVVANVNEQTVTIAAADARGRCPRGAPKGGEKGSVHLVSTISERRDADGKRVYVTCGSNSRDAHAAYVEFGTGQRGSASPSPPKWDGPLAYRADWDGMAAQPFLFPASERQRMEYPQRMKQAMKRAVRAPTTRRSRPGHAALAPLLQRMPIRPEAKRSRTATFSVVALEHKTV